MKKQRSVVSGQVGQAPPPGVLPPAISARTVKAALAQGKATLVELCARLGIPEADFKTRDQVRKILRDLEKFCQADTEGDPGGQGDFDWIYYLVDKPVARGSVQAKLWEFACLRFATAKPFTAAEAARLAECDRDYTKRYCRWLWNSGYLASVSRGRAGALLYQVVGGKEHEPAPAWNRRAEKRKSRGQGSGVRGQEECKDWSPQACCMGTPQKCDHACPLHLPEAGTPAAPAAAGIVARDPAITFFDEPPGAAGDSKTIMRAALEASGVTGSRARLDAALEDFGRALVEVTGSIGRAWEIIREMKGELLAIEEQGHDEPEKPTAGHH